MSQWVECPIFKLKTNTKMQKNLWNNTTKISSGISTVVKIPCSAFGKNIRYIFYGFSLRRRRAYVKVFARKICILCQNKNKKYKPDCRVIDGAFPVIRFLSFSPNKNPVILYGTIVLLFGYVCAICTARKFVSKRSILRMIIGFHDIIYVKFALAIVDILLIGSLGHYQWENFAFWSF